MMTDDELLAGVIDLLASRDLHRRPAPTIEHSSRQEAEKKSFNLVIFIPRARARA